MCFGNTTDHEHSVETAIPSLSNKANTRNNLLASHPSECTQFLQPELNSTRDKCCQPTLGIHRETALHRYTCRATDRNTSSWAHGSDPQIPMTQGFRGRHQLFRVNSEPLCPKRRLRTGNVCSRRKWERKRKASQHTNTLKARFP